MYNGAQSDKDFMDHASTEMKQKREEDRKERLGNGLKMFSFWDDVRSQFQPSK